MQLRTKIIGCGLIACAAGIGLGQWLFSQPWLNGVLGWLALPLSLAVCWIGLAWVTRNLAEGLSALEIGLLNFKDNDFSVNLPVKGDSQIKALAQLFNESADILRKERQYIYQRELLLDKVIQSSPNVMLLLDAEDRIIYANAAARHLFYQSSKMEGLPLQVLLKDVPAELAQALTSKEDVLFSMGEELETWHLSRGRFQLNNQRHNLILLKHMTRELNRQEVAVWKKVIRIVSHELNNSVAPIASMVNSGRMLTRDLNNEKLQLIFDTIEDRTAHLSQFIDNYARFAKLPLPRPSEVDWSRLTEQLAQHYPFTLGAPLPSNVGYFDLVQLEQVLLNLLKNSHESGSPRDAICLTIAEQVRAEVRGFCLHIDDRGSGMSATVLDQALLPFYSTKQSGTGLGLPLCREIVEAHGGHMSLQNRQQGGLRVSVWLPQAPVH
ncbi:ATP-binding protein [Simiduia curdlanivorans]|uniref:sensor histidine kinase n=1 Tax=Simiduia curdlanivorans TaxID=1492769 RepID=UPI0025B5E36A|nr:ATP-binding protein [Simiduia curdlanivorans]MDN3640762.1 ATP-binding protein [Simiduia curdlanivorans]